MSHGLGHPCSISLKNEPGMVHFFTLVPTGRVIGADTHQSGRSGLRADAIAQSINY